MPTADDEMEDEELVLLAKAGRLNTAKAQNETSQKSNYNKRVNFNFYFFY